MSGPPPEPECAGIEIERLEIDKSNALIIVLTEDLGCPSCGRSGPRWVVPTFQKRIFHRPDDGPGRPDPGE